MTLVKVLRTTFLGLFTSVFISAGAVQAEERGTAAEAKAMAEKAIAHMKAAGKEKALADFTAKDTGWQSKDLYVFAITYDGDVQAHGANKALVGKNLLVLKDPSGKSFIKEFAEIAKSKGSGWVDYQFSDPQTKKNLPKTSYIIKWPAGDGYVGVGVYKQ
jgi:cytochrome c